MHSNLEPRLTRPPQGRYERGSIATGRISWPHEAKVGSEPGLCHPLLIRTAEIDPGDPALAHGGRELHCVHGLRAGNFNGPGTSRLATQAPTSAAVPRRSMLSRSRVVMSTPVSYDSRLVVTGSTRQCPPLPAELRLARSECTG
jgi:hypothetical protein